MTIKEVEEILEVSRATIRFYEKEGLITPQREGNRYRDYSDADVEKLKKIIIFRKVGLSVSDIADLFDGTIAADSVFEDTLKNLREQMKELQGSINLCKKIKDDSPEIDSFNPEIYWNYIDEEEKKGNAFLDIAKELAYEEKKIFAARLGWNLDRDGNIYDLKQCVISTIVVLGCFGAIYCKIEGWNIKTMFEGMVKYVFSIILGATFLELPIILLGKKYSWSSRTKTILGLIIAFLLLIGSCIANYYAHHPL
ncbi:MAG: MerR family transcriptional regulator [Butyrivibrio sp.]|nr:MerR family transcriptional regulator [Butyrivibrio sp.]